MARKKRKPTLQQYSARLSPEQIAAGMNAAMRNAKRLYADAELLLQAGRFPTACSIAVLSIEEAGKVAILRRLSLARDDQKAKEIWREYRDHQAKNLMWIVRELASNGAKTIEELRVIVDPIANTPPSSTQSSSLVSIRTAAEMRTGQTQRRSLTRSSRMRS
jgi:AbiV family abortive infection protein